MSELKPGNISRREFLTRAIPVVAGLALSPWLLAACKSAEPQTPPLKKEPSPAGVLDMDLKIPESEWERVVSNRPNWQILPDASDQKNLLHPAWASSISIGKVGPSFKVAINRPLFELMMDKSGLKNPKLPTTIVFVEDWPQVDPNGKGEVEGGLSAITENGQSQLIIIWMKFIAWRSLKLAEYQKLPVNDYFNGISSQMVSEWFVHEMAHSGREVKDFWDPAKNQYKIDVESVHPQIYAFQRRYKELYDKAYKQRRAENALVVGVEAVGNLDQIKSVLYAEADSRGIKFE